MIRVATVRTRLRVPLSDTVNKHAGRREGDNMKT